MVGQAGDEAARERKVRASLLRLLCRSPKFLKEGHLVLLSVYASDARLNTWTGRWERLLESVRQGRDDVRLVYVTPDSSEGDDKRFACCARCDRVGDKA